MDIKKKCSCFERNIQTGDRQTESLAGRWREASIQQPSQIKGSFSSANFQIKWVYWDKSMSGICSMFNCYTIPVFDKFFAFVCFNHLLPMCLSDATACHTTAVYMARFGFLNVITQVAACGWEHKLSSALGTTWEAFLNALPWKCPSFFVFVACCHTVIYNFQFCEGIFHCVKNLKLRPAVLALTRCSFICCSETQVKHQQFGSLQLN